MEPLCLHQEEFGSLYAKLTPLVRFVIAKKEGMKQSAVVTAFWESCNCRLLPWGPLPEKSFGH